MEQSLEPAPVKTRPRGRWLFWLGLTLPFIALGVYIVQFQQHIFAMPWYVPAAAVIGLVALAITVWQRPSVVRIAGLLLIALFCAGQAFFLFSISKLPAYSGPIHAGESIPAFHTTLADGRAFSDGDLKQGKS